MRTMTGGGMFRWKVRAAAAVLAAAVFCTTGILHAAPAEPSIGPIYVDGVEVPFSAAPYIVNGTTTMVQFRPIFEELGMTVTWSKADGRIEGTRPGKRIVLTLGSTVAEVDGKAVTLAAAPVVKGSHTMVPLRFVGEASGYAVDYDKKTGAVTIRSKEETPRASEDGGASGGGNPAATPSEDVPEGNPNVVGSTVVDPDPKAWLTDEEFAQVEQAADRIMAELITAEMTDLQKEKAIFDYLVNHIQYDSQYYSYGKPTRTKPYSLYGALIEGYAVCDGYARAMFYLGRKAGLDILYVSGFTTGEGHAWNMVRIDGEYYHVDATWGEGQREGDPPRYHHFNVTHDDRAYYTVWNVDAYPMAKRDAELAASSKKFDVRINSAVPFEEERMIWVSLSIRWKQGGTDYGRAFAEAVTMTGSDERTITFSLPEMVPVEAGNVEYSLGYRAFVPYSSGGMTMVRNVDGGLAYQASADYGGTSVLNPERDNPEDRILRADKPLAISLMANGIIGKVTYDQAPVKRQGSVNAIAYEDYQLSPDLFALQEEGPHWNPGLPDSKVSYRLTNAKPLVLPPYSALYQTSEGEFAAFEDDFYNYRYGGTVIYANHTGKEITIPAGKLDVYPIRNVTRTVFEGRTRGPFLRVVGYESDFDESEEYRNNRKVKWMTDWIELHPE